MEDIKFLGRDSYEQVSTEMILELKNSLKKLNLMKEHFIKKRRYEKVAELRELEMNLELYHRNLKNFVKSTTHNNV